MQKLLRCDCGFEVRADDDERLVSIARDHALRAHGMELDADQILRLAAARGDAADTATGTDSRTHSEGREQ